MVIELYSSAHMSDESPDEDAVGEGGLEKVILCILLNGSVFLDLMEAALLSAKFLKVFQCSFLEKIS